MRGYVRTAAALCLVWPALPAQAQAVAPAAPATSQATSHVRVLATGGTIAGVGTANGASYRSGQVSVADLIAALPGVEAIASVSGEQVANTASGNIDEPIWRTLHARVMAAMADPGVTGVVITHGTDTLEETAFLLDLLLPRTKPVVVVGSMRPSTAVSADGPQNLMDAIRVAVAPAAVGRGVLVVMNDTIFEPVSVTKVDVQRVEAFAAPTRGPVGDVLRPTARFYAPAGSAQAKPLLTLGTAPFPKVAIVYAHTGLTGDDVRRIAGDAAGVVIAGVGGGGFPTSARAAVRELAARGVAIVRTPRQGFGDITPSAAATGEDSDAAVGTIGGRELTPAKARILLMLALQQPRTRAELQSLFDATTTLAN
ncbi:asparaginase [Sandarakinorhabdus sp.]|uniref:asparaginase n=1 Tax=Sandarakinorhabdus sp. TaxID=1916663 RepID=UPI003F710C70